MTREQMFVTEALSKHLTGGRGTPGNTRGLRQTNLTDCSLSVVYEEMLARALDWCVPGDISVTVSEYPNTSCCWEYDTGTPLLLALGNIKLPMFSNLRS